MSPRKKRPATKSAACRDENENKARNDDDAATTTRSSPVADQRVGERETVRRRHAHGDGDSDTWEDLKRLTRQQLEFAGWIDEVETRCRRIAAETSGERGGDVTVRHAQLLDGVRETMLRTVPDHIKARVLKDIRDKLLLMKGVDDGRREREMA